MRVSLWLAVFSMALLLGCDMAGHYEALAGELCLSDVSVYPSKVFISGGRTSFEVLIKNGGPEKVSLSIDCIQPRRPTAGYISRRYISVIEAPTEISANSEKAFRVYVNTLGNREPWEYWVSVKVLADTFIRHELIVRVLGR